LFFYLFFFSFADRPIHLSHASLLLAPVASPL
jgi:hypothetical protein